MCQRHLAAVSLGLTSLLLPVGLATAAPQHDSPSKQDSPAAPKVDPSHFVIDDENPEGNLPTAEEASLAALKFAELLNGLGARVDAARARGDWKQTVKYDRALMLLAPQRADAFGWLCRDYEQLGQRDDAVQACGEAIQKPGATVDHFARFVRLVAKRPGGLDPTELEDAHNAIDHLKEQGDTRTVGLQLQCELALEQQDDAALEQCSKGLAQAAPEDPASITYAWSYAIRKGDAARARALVEQAKQNDKMKGAVAKMEASTSELMSTSADNGALARLASHPLARWLLGALLAMAGGLLIGRRMMRAGSSV